MTLRRLLTYAVIQLGGEMKVPMTFVTSRPPRVGWADNGDAITVVVDTDDVT